MTQRQVQKLSEATTSAYRSFLLYGPPGSGKTWASLSMFPGKKKLVIDADNKLAVSMQHHPRYAQLKDEVFLWVPPTKLAEGKIGFASLEKKDKSGSIVSQGYVPTDTRGFLEVIGFINDDLPKLMEELDIEVVSLDTLTSIADHLYYLILSHHKRSTFVIDLWGVYKQNMIELTKGFLSLPAHRVMIAHENIREDDTNKEIHVRPSIQGSYRDEIGKEFSEVWHFSGAAPGGGKYQIRTANSHKYMARTAMGLKTPICDLDDAIKACV